MRSAEVIYRAVLETLESRQLLSATMSLTHPELPSVGSSHIVSGDTPAAPTDLSPVAGNHRVTLTWDAMSGATGYAVLRSTTDGGPYTKIAGDVQTTTFVDRHAANGTQYFYAVESRNGDLASSPSTQVSATPIAPPRAPQGLIATAGDSQVSLTWSSSSNAVTYSVEVATTRGGHYTILATGITDTNYVDNTAVNGTTCYYRVCGTDASGAAGSFSASAHAKPMGTLAAVAGLGVTTGNHQVTLDWDSLDGAVNYNVLRSTTDGGPYTIIASNVTATTFVDHHAANGVTYFYVVRGMSPVAVGAYSDQAAATPVAPPHAPTDLVATPGDGMVSLTWSAADGADSYVIERATSADGSYTVITTGVDGTTCNDTTGTPGTTYYYRVAGANVGGRGSFSASANSTTLVALGGATGMYAAGGNGQVYISWNAVAGANSYTVERSTVSGGSYTNVAVVTTTSYYDTSVTNGVTYFYVVRAAARHGRGQLSAEVSTTPIAPPGAPSGLTASASTGQVSLSWNAPDGAVSYSVLRSTVSGGPFTTLVSGLTTTSYQDTTVTNGTTYYYCVTATDSIGTSAQSAQVSALPLAPPAAPTGLTATAGDTRVTLAWNAAAMATSYIVQRSTTSGGTFSTIASNVTSTSYQDTSVTNGTTYYYRVCGTNTVGAGSLSAQASAQPLAMPATPTGLTAAAGAGQVSLAWTAAANDAAFTVKRSTTSGGSYTTIVTGLTTASYVDNTVTNGVTYYYVVCGTGPGGASANSAQASALPMAVPASPTGLTATAGNNQISLVWTAASSSTSYIVQRSTTSGGTFTTIASNVTSTSYVDNSAANGTTYYYVVEGYNSVSGAGAASAQASATPAAPTGPGGPLTVSSVTTAQGLELLITGTSNNDQIDVLQSGSNYTIENGSWTDIVTGTFSTLRIDAGSGDDSITVDASVTISASLFGGAGNDTLVGNAAGDCFYAGTGNDVICGGGSGNDIFVTLGATSASITSGGGADSFWMDQSNTENITDLTTAQISGGEVHRVNSFMNSATFSTEPTVDGGISYANFSGQPLFSTSGPSANDIHQGNVGDCYFLAVLSSVAKVDANTIRQSVVSLGDGTFAVQFWSNGVAKFVHVDGQLPVWSGSMSLAYEGEGAGGSIWASIMEKAFADFRVPATPSYDSINSGWMTEVYSDLDASSAASSYGWTSNANLLSTIASELAAADSVTVATDSSISGGAPLIANHAYMVDSIVTVGGQQEIVLRNPWGFDGAGSDSNPNDGYVTITAAQGIANFVGLVGAKV